MLILLPLSSSKHNICALYWYYGVVILFIFCLNSGISGIGKTEIALQLIKQYEDQRKERPCKVFRLDSCKTSNALSASLRDLAKSHGLRLPAFEDEVYVGLEEIFNQLYTEVARSFPNHDKLFLFDDAEPDSKLLLYLDKTICKKALKDADHSWKIIVTAQKDENDSSWLLSCDYIRKAHFKCLNRFEEQQSRDYLYECIRTREKLSSQSVGGITVISESGKAASQEKRGIFEDVSII